MLPQRALVLQMLVTGVKNLGSLSRKLRVLYTSVYDSL